MTTALNRRAKQHYLDRHAAAKKTTIVDNVSFAK